MSEKVTLKRISVTDKKKDGTILENQYGKFYRIGIQTEEYPEQWINGFSGQPVDWQEGDVVELEISKEEYQGQEQLKFKLPNKNSQLEARVKKLEETVFGKDEPSQEQPDNEPSIDDF